MLESEELHRELLYLGRLPPADAVVLFFSNQPAAERLAPPLRFAVASQDLSTTLWGGGRGW